MKNQGALAYAGLCLGTALSESGSTAQCLQNHIDCVCTSICVSTQAREPEGSFWESALPYCAHQPWQQEPLSSKTRAVMLTKTKPGLARWFRWSKCLPHKPGDLGRTYSGENPLPKSPFDFHRHGTVCLHIRTTHSNKLKHLKLSSIELKQTISPSAWQWLSEAP